MQMTQALCFVRVLNHLVLNGDGQCQSLGCHTFHEKHSNRLIEIRTRNALTGWLSVLNAFARAVIIGNDALTASLVIAHSHPFSTGATHDESDVESAVPSRGGEKRSG